MRKATVVLHGAPDASKEFGESDETFARMTTAIESHREHGGDFVASGRFTEKALKYMAGELEHNTGKVFWGETDSGDTVSNGLYSYTGFIRPRAIEQVELVTSDYHMRRSQYIFNKIVSKSVEVVPVPSETDYHGKEKLEIYAKEAVLLGLSTWILRGVELNDEDSIEKAKERARNRFKSRYPKPQAEAA